MQFFYVVDILKFKNMAKWFKTVLDPNILLRSGKARKFATFLKIWLLAKDFVVPEYWVFETG